MSLMIFSMQLEQIDAQFDNLNPIILNPSNLVGYEQQMKQKKEKLNKIFGTIKLTDKSKFAENLNIVEQLIKIINEQIYQINQDFNQNNGQSINSIVEEYLFFCESFLVSLQASQKILNQQIEESKKSKLILFFSSICEFCIYCYKEYKAITILFMVFIFCLLLKGILPASKTEGTEKTQKIEQETKEIEEINKEIERIISEQENIKIEKDKILRKMNEIKN